MEQKVELLPCPFCGGEGEYAEIRERIGYGSYERTETYHRVVCRKCGSHGRQLHQRCLADYTNYTVGDFRNDPALRARVEDEYDLYIADIKEIAIEAWNTRA